MSVDLSNRKFIFKDTLPTGIGTNITSPFWCKVSPADWRSFYSMTYSSGKLEFTYGQYGAIRVTLYQNGAWEWGMEGYREIVFSAGTTVGDSVYAVLAQLADEVNPYLVQDDSLGAIGNALRDRNWDNTLYEDFPDGIADRIRSTGNYIRGGTVGWNQLQANTKSRSNAGVDYTFNSVTGELTVYGTATASSWWLTATDIQWNFYIGHKYLFHTGAGYTYSGGTGSPKWYLPSGFSPNANLTKEWSIIPCTSDTTTYMQFQAFTGNEVDATYVPMCFDLTAIFGAAIADWLYTKEQQTAGAGVAAFRALFPEDYYPYNAGKLTSVEYTGRYPFDPPIYVPGLYKIVNDELKLAVYSEFNENGYEGHRGMYIQRVGRVMLDDNVTMNWQYDSTNDIFRSNGLQYGYAIGIPSSDTVNATVLTAAYPVRVINLDDTPWTSAESGYLYQWYKPSNLDYNKYQICIKDTSITSDHVNTLLTKLAGKELVFEKVKHYYNDQNPEIIS